MAHRRLRTIFFGSSDFSVPSLQRLIQRHEVIAVCSQPAKLAGRGLALTPTPVSVAAKSAGIEVLTPAKLDAGFAATLAALRPEFLACASYGKIVPRAILETDGVRAALNVHPSLLPRYRGSTPIQSALREGCATTGVTIFWMVQALDAGDIAASRTLPIAAHDTYGTLHDKLAAAGADLLLECTEQLIVGTLPRVPQNENEATYTKPLSKQDLRLDCLHAPQTVINQIRSLSPRPAAWTSFANKRLKILEARVYAGRLDSHVPDEALPGSVFASGGRTLIKTQPGYIEALRVILEGKAEMSGTQIAQRTIGQH